MQYPYVHVADETEVDHFLVVVKALNAYCTATESSINYIEARQLFEQYLSRVGKVMESLTASMEQEKNAAPTNREYTEVY
ncbi:MAG: hypothetical protein F6K54_29965 [Okeania sp. SIO3B5]|uniref:hypothetical protein n=1 Tax=Okeania sp. SIO3B5 TaxID=2607811 RepID=UPI0013FFCE0B|nr:hypothetical protein [Okeania sp. SIO3B5]NEO56928.1 hypothetical protein [Okeania sp. SIO3B5]